jgi:DNA (cytosine-5)-methyltransferase 1
VTLTFGSLFAGIGGMDLGLERAGMRCAWQVEIDPYCRRVLERHWPQVPKFNDVRDVGAHNLEPVDLICGGFPCQDVSNAGKRAGLAGERSGLWSEYARIVCELRPRFVLVENVAALLARGLGTVLGDLAACGYDAEWDCIPAAAVGAPHRRDRLWLVAHPKGFGGALWPPKNGRQGRPAGGRADVADADRPRLEGRVLHREGARQLLAGARGESLAGIWGAEPDVGRVANGVPARVDRLRCLGNAVVPQVAEWIGRRIVAVEGLA